MKRIIFSALLLLAFGWVAAQEAYGVRQASMSIVGTSTLHDWESKVTTVSARGQLDMGTTILEAIPELVVSLKVRDIISPKGSIMDKKTYEALKSDKHPNITFKLARVKSIQPAAKGFTVVAEGQLTIAGVTKTTDITATGVLQSDGSVVFEGSKPLKMTTYGVAPPTAVMGTIKTGDDITVRFKVTLAPTK